MNKSHDTTANNLLGRINDLLQGFFLGRTHHFVSSISQPNREYTERIFLNLPSLVILPTGSRVINLMTEIREMGSIWSNCFHIGSVSKLPAYRLSVFSFLLPPICQHRSPSMKEKRVVWASKVNIGLCFKLQSPIFL